VEDDPDTAKHPVFEIFMNDDKKAVPPEEILICNLSKACIPPALKTYQQKQPDGTYINNDMKITVVADPVCGRFIFTDPGAVTKARISYSYGFSGDLGSGPFSRQASIADAFQQKTFITGGVEKQLWQRGVSKTADIVNGEIIYKTIKEAVDEWNLQPAGTTGVILIMDNATYDEDLIIDIPENSSLLLAAADWPIRENEDTGLKERTAGGIAADELRPLIKGDITVNGVVGQGSIDFEKKTGGLLTLNGLLLEGKVEVAEGNLGILNIDYCTLIPGNGGLVIGADVADPLSNSNQWLTVNLERTICGGVSLNHTPLVSFTTGDCIITNDPAAVTGERVPVKLINTTIWGTVTAKMIEASNCIFNNTVKAPKRHGGTAVSRILPLKRN
jgi:hypothetical protein